VSDALDYVVTFTAPQQAELKEVKPDERPLAGDEITGRTLVSLISPGTEIGGSYLEGRYPSQPGYAAVFEIDAVGDGVEDVKVGDVVLCTGPGGIGGHRSRQRCPRQTALRLPEGLLPEVAAHARLMSVSMSTLTTTTARPPEKVLVSGLGPIGHLAAQSFQACGYRVMAVEPVEWRRRLAEQKGIEPVWESLPLEQRTLLEGIALVVECSGHEQAVLDACRAVRKRGEVVLVGVPRSRRSDLYAFDILQTVFRRYVVLRSGWEWEVPRHGGEFRAGSVFDNIAAALRWLADGRVRVNGLYRTVSPRDAQQAYQDLLHRSAETFSIVFDWREIA
jgi:threonine dehydrogenase-like Zn-dependent dehydrogenase